MDMAICAIRRNLEKVFVSLSIFLLGLLSIQTSAYTLNPPTSWVSFSAMDANSVAAAAISCMEAVCS